MNKLLRSKCILGALFALVAVGTAQAFTFQFDENGNGLLDGQTVQGLSWTTDPTGGVPAGTPILVYPVPGGLGNKDVRIWEDSSQTVLSDVLRFFGDTFQGFMIFYSDKDANWEMADSGLPAVLYPDDGGGVLEGADGSFDFFIDQHRFIGNSGNDVPDGGFTVALLGLAMAGLVGMRRSTAV